jgi:protein-S-isoprenylcysteine O-methyltransferase Ste14
MDIECPFKIVLILLYTCFTTIRAHYRRTTFRSRADEVGPDHTAYGVYALIAFEVSTLFTILFFPHWLAWATMPLPTWLRWFGTVLGIAALLLFIWVHHSLGPNFSVALCVQDRHTLVTSGPYRWIRHPMYTAFYILHLATWLLTANGFIGATWIAGLTLLIAWRIRREERMMIKKFGKEYRSYIEQTRRFL